MKNKELCLYVFSNFFSDPFLSSAGRFEIKLVVYCTLNQVLNILRNK